MSGAAIHNAGAAYPLCDLGGGVFEKTALTQPGVCKIFPLGLYHLPAYAIAVGSLGYLDHARQSCKQKAGTQ